MKDATTSMPCHSDLKWEMRIKMDPRNTEMFFFSFSRSCHLDSPDRVQVL